MISNRYRPAKKGSWTWLLIILGVGIAGLVFQAIRYQRNRPLIIAEAAVADAEGEAKFEALGVPPRAAPTSPGEKRAITKSPHAPTSRIVWQREYEFPGAFDPAHEWYRKRLLGEGWKEFRYGPTSELVRMYRKDKWLVTISRMADFDHPPRTRIELQLEWSYWHRQD
jgi:hypothetical protein